MNQEMLLSLAVFGQLRRIPQQRVDLQIRRFRRPPLFVLLFRAERGPDMIDADVVVIDHIASTVPDQGPANS